MEIKKIIEGMKLLLKENSKTSTLREGYERMDETFKFTFRKISGDVFELKCNEITYQISAFTDDREDVLRAIEDFAEYDLASQVDYSEEVTGTEITGFKYNEETGEGEFEVTIFYPEDEYMDESLEEKDYTHETFEVEGKEFSLTNKFKIGKVYIQGIHPYDMQEYHWACGELEPEVSEDKTFGTYIIYRFSPGQKQLVVRGTKEDVAKAIIKLDKNLESRIDKT